MRGIGRANAAITIVNALPTGIGSAIGIDLTVEARAEVHERSAGPSEIRFRPGVESSVVRAAAQGALARAYPGRLVDLELDLESEIPPAVGLKSSSAVASAVHRAILDSAGLRDPPETVAAASAAAGKASGVSATGAFDDAIAGLEPGFFLTDNRTNSVLHRAPAPDQLEVAVYVPGGVHPRSPELTERFRRAAPASKRAVRLAEDDAWWSALEANSVLVESIMQYDYARLRTASKERGAAAAGVTGLGPSFVIVGPPQLVRETIEFPGGSRCAPRSTRFTRRHAE